jgi:hypothetical protein
MEPTQTQSTLKPLSTDTMYSGLPFSENDIVTRIVTRYGVAFRECNAYAFMCGYIQRVENASENESIALWREGSVYNLSYNCYDLPSDDAYSSNYRTFESFYTLTEAKRAFNALVKGMQYKTIKGVHVL